jgi:hypothetical protein
MSAVTAQSEIRLARLIDESDLNRQKHENLLQAVNDREDKTLSATEEEHVALYRETSAKLDAEIDSLSQDVEAAKLAAEKSKAIRRVIAGMSGSVDIDGDGVMYRDFASYAHDVIITGQTPECSKIAKLAGNDNDILAARERLQLLKRTPANTLSSNVAGLQPPQYIAQIFQVINNSRPLVDSARRTTLERGTLTYPVVTQRPIVAVQATQKTEAGNQGMVVNMVTKTASTYLGGGDLSWQAINWSTPDALQLWFDLAASDYALKTEQDAAQKMQHSAFTNDIGTLLSSTPTYVQFLTAVGAGAAKVYAVSGRLANTIYMSVDRYWYVFGLASDNFAQFTNTSTDSVGPLRIVPSRGLDSGVIVVGDSQGLLVAETAGAPVELRVVEPAIGGVEVGIIGAFDAEVVDDGAFSMITTAS